MKPPRYVTIESGGYGSDAQYAQHLNSPLGDYFHTPAGELERMVIDSYDARKPLAYHARRSSYPFSSYA